MIAFGIYQSQQQCKEDLSATRDLIGQAIANHMLNQMQQSGARTALVTMQSACDDFDAKKAQAIGTAIAVHLSFANDVSVASPAQIATLISMGPDLADTNASGLITAGKTPADDKAAPLARNL